MGNGNLARHRRPTIPKACGLEAATRPIQGGPVSDAMPYLTLLPVSACLGGARLSRAGAASDDFGGVGAVAAPALLEEILEQAGAIVSQNTRGDFEAVVEPAVADNVV